MPSFWFEEIVFSKMKLLFMDWRTIPEWFDVIVVFVILRSHFTQDSLEMPAPISCVSVLLNRLTFSPSRILMPCSAFVDTWLFWTVALERDIVTPSYEFVIVVLSTIPLASLRRN